MQKMKIVFQKGIAQLVILGIMGLLAIVLPVATKLVQQNQENRSQAALPTCSYSSNAYSIKCDGGKKCTCNPSSGSWSCVSCPSGQTCKSGATACSTSLATTCTDGGIKFSERYVLCNKSNNTYRVCWSGGVWSPSKSCTSGQQCNSAGTACVDIPAPVVNGNCGSTYDSHPTVTSAPATGLCSAGVASTVILQSTTNHYTWTCSGTNGGSYENCYAIKAVPPAPPKACTADTQYRCNGKILEQCNSSGTGWTTKQTCGTNESCYADEKECRKDNCPTTSLVGKVLTPGQKACGTMSTNKNYLYTCNAGNDVARDVCPGTCSNGACVAAANKINGLCNENITAAPTSSSCVSGTFKDQPDFSGHWIWDCEGANGGTTAHCNVATPCVPGQKVCANDLGLKECNTAGTDWKLTSCSWGCDYTKNECKTATGICGSYTNLTACNNAGCWWSYDGGNSCQVCNNNPQQYKCDGRNLMKCNSSGSAWTLNRECGIDQTCNATTKTCDSKTGGSTGGNTGGSTGGNTGGSTGGNTGGSTGGDTGGGETPATLSGIKLSPNPLYLMVGKSWKVGVETIPGGLTSEYTWKSDDANIASVDMLGNVKGVTLGETYITATAKGTDISDKIKVVVDPDGSVTPEACTGYVYDEWSDCKNGTQTRNLLSKTPDGCTGNPSYAPVTTQECSDVAISYKIAFAGILPGAKCIDEYLIPETRIETDIANIPSIANGKYTDKIQASFEETDETDSKGNRIFQVTNLVLDKDKFGSVNNFNYVKVKGPWHLKRRMCQDGQGKKMPESTVCDINLKANSGKVYDFSEYTLLAGDITADGSKRGDGVINSLDLGYIKTRLNPGSGVNCGREGDLNMDGVVNSIDLNLVKTSLTERDDE